MDFGSRAGMTCHLAGRNDDRCPTTRISQSGFETRTQPAQRMMQDLGIDAMLLQSAGY